MNFIKKKKTEKKILADIKDYLPIGSVVKLSNNNKYLIYGFAQAYTNKPKDQYDYIGVPYPEGNLLSDDHIMFDHNDITEICFRGYTDEDYDSFIEMMDAMTHM